MFWLSKLKNEFDYDNGSTYFVEISIEFKPSLIKINGNIEKKIQLFS